MDNEQKKETVAQAGIESLSKRGFERFQKHVLEGDDVTAVLKAHLLAEHYIDQLILASFARGDVLLERDSGMSFRGKLRIVEALKVLPPEQMTALQKLNSLRNNCAHELDFSIAESEVEKLGMPLGQGYLKMKVEDGERPSILLRRVLTAIVASLAGISDRTALAATKKLTNV